MPVRLLAIMADFFSTLTAGLSFNKKRFGKDIGVFTGKADGAATLNERAAGHASTSAAPPPEVQTNDPVEVGACSEPQARRRESSREAVPSQAANVIRKHYRIKVKGDAPPPPLKSFEELGNAYGCPAEVLEALRQVPGRIQEAGGTMPDRSRSAGRRASQSRHQSSGRRQRPSWGTGMCLASRPRAAARPSPSCCRS